MNKLTVTFDPVAAGKGREPLTDDPAYYESVWLAAGGAGSVCAPAREPWEVEPPAPAPASRINSPLTLALERRLAERAGKPRQFPKGRVDTGNPSQPGDDAVYEYPGHGEKVS